MDTRAMTAVGGRYYNLRGLNSLPTGLVFIAAGAFNMPPIGDEPVSTHAAWFVAAMVLAALGYYASSHYYATHFGRVEPTNGTRVRVAVYTVLGAVLICGGITLDMQLELPVSLFGAAFGISLMVYYRMLDVLQRYHLALLGGFTIVCLLPLWGQVDDKVSTTMIPMGLVTIAVGLLDHRDLVGSMQRARHSAIGGDADGRR